MADKKRYRVVITSEVECVPEDPVSGEYGDTPYDAASDAIVALGHVWGEAAIEVTDLATGQRWVGRHPGMDFEPVR